MLYSTYKIKHTFNYEKLVEILEPLALTSVKEKKWCQQDKRRTTFTCYTLSTDLNVTLVIAYIIICTLQYTPIEPAGGEKLRKVI